ncbi:asparagine synthetase (glutamine-hydrolyzing) [Beggiatoa sp. PS]|nr:asparagine synthetase (glutamine-hydrolyzing) [Beggiatoa sp. PS]
MCGITGFISQTGISVETLNNILVKMGDVLVHRGPDDQDIWLDKETGVGLAHRRLSIVDLSQQGHQPMLSHDGRFVIVFNGEIYNYLDIRKELEKAGVTSGWRGHSDTEVMLAAISQWGLEKAVKRFVGMFAFALWDRDEKVLYLVRDRMGEKPLYYGWMGNTFLFGSELKALRVHPAWRGEIDKRALALLMRYCYIPAPYSIYQDIFKLLPGTILSLPFTSKSYQIRPYWSAQEVVEQGINNPYLGTEKEAIEQLDVLLRDSIKQQMIADVPLGAFLSGGIDSSTVVALMQAQSERPVKTFSIGFSEADYNEAQHAKAVAQHLGTEHTELYVTPKQAIAVIPNLPTLYDEPFADSSQIPTFLISQLTRQQVTVSLSGDAGDELFGGYKRYFLGQSLWNKVGWLPQNLRGLMAKMLTTVSPQIWDSVFSMLSPCLPSKLKLSTPGHKMHKLARFLTVTKPEEMYDEFMNLWANLVIADNELPTVLTDSNKWDNSLNFTENMMYLDMISYLPDDILVKVDRATMGVSLESRVPFLDHRIVEFAWRIPLSMKIRNNQGKWLLRQVLYQYVPKALIERPKMGFGIPLDSWLRGPLKEWAENLLAKKRLKEEGFFHTNLIQQKWEEHLSGKRNWQYYLWNVLMFEAWLEQQ